ncbi:MAG: helix-turn-helix transcriptional regulator [Bosea sp.]|nr:helix-turn-helix transcriptional regulator [Bosea sp. (in: a-proteobacteria)]
MIITPEQCRAARAWLDWKQSELAEAASVSASTVRDFEKERRIPTAANARAIVIALSRAGIVLTWDERGLPLGVERKRILDAPTQM